MMWSLNNLRLHVCNSQNVNNITCEIHQSLSIINEYIPIEISVLHEHFICAYTCSFSYSSILLLYIFTFTLLRLSFCKLLFIDLISVPIPLLEVTLSRQCDLLAGSNLTLTCDISVDPNVDTPFDVNVSWNKTDQPVMSGGNTGIE